MDSKLSNNSSDKLIDGTVDIYVTSTGDVYRKYLDKKYVYKPRLNNRGYGRVRLRPYGAYKEFLVHRLVAIYHVPNDDPDIKRLVNHIDGNKLNNNADNLEWCTHAMNMKHAFTSGVIDVSKVGKAKNSLKGFGSLTPEQRSEWGRKGGKARLGYRKQK